MKNPNSKTNKINIIFSSFLIIGYIICTYFFTSIASQISGIGGSLLQILILLLFGLLLFYATRVGEGKQVRRFSLAVLLLIDIPALYLIIASLVPALPLHDFIVPANSAVTMLGMSTTSAPSIILMMACVALGYGIPYTFFAGYELKEENDEAAEDEAVVEGGLAEELAETENESEEAVQTAEDAAVEEAVEETAEADDEAEAAKAAEEIVKEATEEVTEEVEDSEKEAE